MAAGDREINGFPFSRISPSSAFDPAHYFKQSALPALFANQRQHLSAFRLKADAVKGTYQVIANFPNSTFLTFIHPPTNASAALRANCRLANSSPARGSTAQAALLCLQFSSLRSAAVLTGTRHFIFFRNF